MHNDLGDHWIELGAYFAASFNSRIEAGLTYSGGCPCQHRPWRRQKTFGWILSIQTRFYSVTIDADVRLAERQGLAFGDANLLAHQVFADDLLGNRMLYL